LKILYVLWKYPQLSETYVTAEIDFALSQGIKVEVWTEWVIHVNLPVQCPVHRGTLAQAIDAVKPDLIHVHYLLLAERFYGLFPPSVPVTVRGHSFDWNPAQALRVAQLPSVRKVFVFPAFASQVPHPKITDLPVAYSTRSYAPVIEKDRRLVLRLTAGLPTKALADFFTIARELPEHRFVMGVSTADRTHGFDPVLRAMSAGQPVDVRMDLPWEEARALTALAGICLHTADPAYLFGMPISIVEALATGSFALARRLPGVELLLGPAGRLYSSCAEAAAIIRETQGWSDGDWAAISRDAVLRAKMFSDSEVLPKLLNEWRLATGKA
jgi:hypothetical protein